MKTCFFGLIGLGIISVFSFCTIACTSDPVKPNDGGNSGVIKTISIDSLVIDDYFITETSKGLVLEVLKNDNFIGSDDLKISKVSVPTNGTLVINADMTTLTYTPSDIIPIPESPITDTFTYTVELTKSNGDVGIGMAKVDIVIVPETITTNAKLLFSSGFEGAVVMEPLGATMANHQFITGTDSETGFTWPPVLGGSTLNALKLIQDGGNLFNSIETVEGHTGVITKAMYNKKLANTSDITQSPYQLNFWQFNPDKFYIRYWMKVNDSFKGKNNFRVIWETKTYNYENGGGFRMAALMNIDSDGKEVWEFRGDTKPGFDGVIWSTYNNQIPFPTDTWFMVEFFVDFAQTGNGRAFFKMNGHTIGDVTNVTNINSDNLQVMMLTQIYGSVEYMDQYIDDIEILDDKPYKD